MTSCFSTSCTWNCCDSLGDCPTSNSTCYTYYNSTAVTTLTNLASLSLGAIIGIIVGIVVIISLTIGLCVWRCRRNALLAMKAQAVNTTMIVQGAQMGGMQPLLNNQQPPMPMYNGQMNQPTPAANLWMMG